MPKSVFTDAYAVLLQTLIEARKASGVRQTDLAKALGKPQPWVSNYETGIRRLDVIEFVAIARAIGVKPERLFKNVVDKLPKDIEI